MPMRVQPQVAVAIVEPICVDFPTAGSMVGVSEWMIYKWVREGRLSAIQVASDRRIMIEELRDFIANRAANPPKRGRPPKNAKRGA